MSSSPPGASARNISYLSHCDQGGRPDGVQVILHKGHAFIGHMFADGFSVVDVRDPKKPKTVAFVAAPKNTRSHHIQIAGDVLMVVNGPNIWAMQQYASQADYYAKSLADSVTTEQPFGAGVRTFDISNPANPREIGYLHMPGFGGHRIWWVGDRYAYVSVHFEGFIDHALAIIDMADPAKPRLAGRWWLPGMNRAGGEEKPASFGKRTALHHLISAGNIGYAAWRDGGFTIHDIADPANPKLLSHINWSPPYPGGTHTPLPLPGRKLAIVADESNADYCAKGLFYTWVLDVRADENPVPIATMPTPTDRGDYCKIGNFGPHNLHENRPGSFQSEEIIFATYHDAGVRVFDIRDQYQPKEIASWVPPPPTKMFDPRPNVAKCAMTCDCYVTPQGLMYVSDWNAGMHVMQFEG